MNKQQNRSEVEQGPIVLADGSRGIYATQTAARNLLAMSRNGLWDIAGIDRGDLELVASTNVSEATDEQAEQVGYVWDDIARNLEAHSAAYGRGWSIHEDGDIFLVRDGGLYADDLEFKSQEPVSLDTVKTGEGWNEGKF